MKAIQTLSRRKQIILSAALATGFFLAQPPVVQATQPQAAQVQWCDSWLAPIEWAHNERTRGTSITNAFRAFIDDDFTAENEKVTLGRLTAWVYSNPDATLAQMQTEWINGCYTELGVIAESQ